MQWAEMEFLSQNGAQSSSVTMLCSRRMNDSLVQWVSITTAAAKAKGCMTFPVLQKKLKSQWKLVLGYFCIHILLIGENW